MGSTEELNPMKIRDQYIELPGEEDGYAKVLLLGTTGAGKTTLLRQIIGSHPFKDRFPSTAPGRTTVCDVEIILKEVDEYKAIITFFPLEKIRAYICECLVQAGKAHITGEDEQVVYRRFFESSDQRFRLNYILGTIKLSSNKDDMLEDLDDEDIDEENFEGLEEESFDSLQRREEILKGFINSVKTISKDVWHGIEELFDGNLGAVSKEEQEILESWFEEYFVEDKRFTSLVDNILTEIKGKFDLISVGIWDFGDDGWPRSWRLTTSNREEMITVLRKMTGNHQKYFGSLLTPLVQGIRVMGPFRPLWYQGNPLKLVLMDGEGLFHEATANSSLPTGILNRIDDADAVLLVDDATHPMMHAPMFLLKHMITSGNEAKLYICFTHFDGIKGDNFPDVAARKAHVRNRLDGALKSLSETLGGSGIRNLNRYLNAGRVFFLGHLHKVLNPQKHAGTCNELNKLVHQLQNSIIKETIDVDKETFDLGELLASIDETRLIEILQEGAENFYEKWKAILGFKYSSRYRKEHWARIKALTRRLSFGEDGYADLYPVSDLMTSLLDAVYGYIESMVQGEKVSGLSEEFIDSIKSDLRNHFYKKMRPEVIQKLNRDRMADWMIAYEFRGKGSSVERAKKIMQIYQDVFPELVSKDITLVKELLRITKEAFSVVSKRLAGECK